MTTDAHDNLMTDSAQLDDAPPQTMPLLGSMVHPDEPVGIDADADLPISAGGGRRWTMLVGVVFVIAAGSLYLMRKTQTELLGGETAAELESKIDQALASNLIAASDDAQNTDEIVSMFSTDPARQQVPLQYVYRNPFILPTPQADEPQAAPVVAQSPNDQAKRQAQHLAELKSQVARLKLQTVMQGRFPLAIINGEIVKTGQSIGNFRVDKITDRTVELSAGDHTFTLLME
jgi:hypothetical protein